MPAAPAPARRNRPRTIPASFTREIASADAASGRVAFPFRYEDLHPSRILQERSLPGQKLGELYDHMLESDTDLAAFASKRRDAVLALPREIFPADGTPLALEIAQFCRDALSLIPNFATNLHHQLAAVAKGIAFDELVWERLVRGPLAGAWVPVDLIDRPMHRFLFREGKLHVRRVLGGEPVPAPEGKFLVFRCGTKDSPWGKALLDEVYWIWWLKKNGLKFYATYLDKWAQPTAVGRYKHRPGGSKDAEQTNQSNQSLLLEAIETIQHEYGVALPEGLTIDLLEAQRSGSATYEQFIGLLTRAESLRFLGEVDTSGVAKGPGSFAKSRVSNEVRLEKVVLDARELSAHLRDNLLRVLVAVNYGDDAPVPRFAIDTVEAEDRQLRGEGIQSVLSLGLAVPKRYVLQTYQVPAAQPGDELVTRAAAPEPPPPPPPGEEPPEDDDPNPDGPDDSGGGGAPPDDGEGQASGDGAVELSGVIVLAEEDLAEVRALAETHGAELDEAAATLARRSIDYYQGWLPVLEEAFTSGAVADGTGLAYLMERIDPREQGEAIETAMMHAVGLGYRQLGVEIGAANVRTELPPDWSNANTPTDAIAFWSQLLNLPKSAFLGLADPSRRLAFTVAGITDAETLRAIYLLMGQAVAEGWGRERWVSELDALMERLGQSPLRRWHAELIYANNVRNLVNLVRYRNLVGNPRAKRLSPYLTWLTLDDGRVRDRHLAMHEKVFATDHEIWKTWWPPAGHNCRCQIGPISAVRARRLGLTGDEPTGPWPLVDGFEVLPDDGFVGAPALEPLTEQLETRAREQVADARESPDLLQSLLDLFLNLLGLAAGDFSLAAPAPGGAVAA